MMNALRERLSLIKGDTGVWAYNCASGEIVDVNADAPLVAASVIKLPIMAAAYRAREQGIVDFNEVISYTKEDMLPSCGALTYLEPYGIRQIPLGALIELMIILSDNSATNLIIRRLLMDYINEAFCHFGLKQTVLRRKLFDAEASRNGLENTVSAREMGEMLKRLCGMADAPLVSRESDKMMLQTLLNQRLNGKIPFQLEGVRVAHKTGEDDGVTHDVGIVFDEKSMKPLCVMCFLSEHVNVPAFERFIQDEAAALVKWARA